MNEKNNYEVEVESDDTQKNSQVDTKDTLQSIEQNYVDICINIDLLLSAFKSELQPKNYKFNVYDLEEKDLKTRHKETMDNLNLLMTIVNMQNKQSNDKNDKSDKNEKNKKKDGAKEGDKK